MKKHIIACLLMLAGMSLAGCANMTNAAMSGIIAQSMDTTDRTKMSRTLENNAIGQSTYWSNPKSGATYHLTPIRNVAVNGNRYCREYRFVSYVNKKKQQANGTACRQANRTWKVMSN